MCKTTRLLCAVCTVVEISFAHYASVLRCLLVRMCAAAAAEDHTTKPGLSSEWCAFDTGRASVTGSATSAYISVTRDGSVWLRLGDNTYDWTLVDRRRPRVQTPVLTDDMLDLLKSTSATDYCVLTDLNLQLTVQGAWHPSYLTFYDPSLAENRIVSVRVSHRKLESISLIQYYHVAYWYPTT